MQEEAKKDKIFLSYQFYVLFFMPAERYFIKSPLVQNSIISMDEEEAHHLIKVMRGRVGDKIELVNGKGDFAIGEVESINKREAQILVLEHRHHIQKNPIIHLLQAIPRPNRLSFILEKGTELGVGKFWLFAADYSEKESFNAEQLKRLQTITIAALKQSGNLHLPEIRVFSSLKECLAEVNHPYFYGDTSPSAPLFMDEILHISSFQHDLFFVVGPEKGFSDKENQDMQSNHGLGVCLHNNILRTDTAGLAAVSIMQQVLMKAQSSH